jgi:hypothetical protein
MGGSVGVVYEDRPGVDALVSQTSLDPLRIVADGHQTRHRWRQGPRTRTRSGGSVPVGVGEIQGGLIGHLSNPAGSACGEERPVLGLRSPRDHGDTAPDRRNADNASALSGFRIGHQPSRVGPSSSPRLRFRCSPQGAPETLLSLNYHHCSAVDARHSGKRLRGAQRAWSRARTPPGAPVPPSSGTFVLQLGSRPAVTALTNATSVPSTTLKLAPGSNRGRTPGRCAPKNAWSAQRSATTSWGLCYVRGRSVGREQDRLH